MPADESIPLVRQKAGQAQDQGWRRVTPRKCAADRIALPQRFTHEQFHPIELGG
jgi:hypothetical protein